MTENELATVAIDICFVIHREFGPGLLESVYESAFVYELSQRNISFTRQEGIKVFYRGVNMDLGFRADLILENKFLIELKSVEYLEKVHHKRVITYLKLKGIKLGLLVNFNVELIKEGIHRKIWGQISE